MFSKRLAALLFSAVAFSLGCGSDARMRGSPDGGPPADAGGDGGIEAAPDAGGGAGPADAGPTDAGPTDAGPAELRCDPGAPFGAPVSLAGISTDQIESAPSLSADELTLYFYRVGASSADLYVAHRPTRGSAFAEPSRLAIDSDTSNDFDPFITSDGLMLLFASTRAGGMGGTDIYVALRESVLDELLTASVLPGVGSPADDTQPFLAWDGSLWLGSSRTGDSDIYRAGPAGFGFATPERVASLSTSAQDAVPILSADGTSVYFASTRTDGGARGGWDIWTASRPTTDQSFGPPRNVSELNTPGFDRPGWLSADGCRLYFGSDGGSGDLDVLVAERAPLD